MRAAAASRTPSGSASCSTRAHGLTIASDRSLDGLAHAPANSTPDLILQSGVAPIAEADRSRWFDRRYQPGDGPPDLVATRLNGGQWLEFAYTNGPTFVMDAGARHVWASASSSPAADGLDDYLLGPILGIALRLRGALCLHASAVDIGGRACAFAGPAGAGKSTMAASFARAGFPVLADDTITLIAQEALWMVAPAFPRLRLWPEALRALGMETDPAAARETGTDDVRYRLDLRTHGWFGVDPVPLASVYLIEFEDGPSPPRIETLSPAGALSLLAANTYANRVLDRGRRAREFQSLADLLETVRIRRLVRAPNFEELARVCEVILDDADA